MNAFGRSYATSADGEPIPSRPRKASQKQIAANRALQARLAKEAMTRELKRDIRRRATQTRRRPAKLDKPAPQVSNAYARASAMLYEDPRMSDSARRLVLRLVQWGRGRPAVTAYIAQLADSLGLSVRTIRYAQQRAQRCGFIMVERTRKGRVNDVNIYHLTDKAQRPKRPYARRGYHRTRPSVELQHNVQDSASHEELANAKSPLKPPRGGESESSPNMAMTGALKRASSASKTGETRPINPLGEGPASKSVPGLARKRTRLLPETRPKP